MAYATDPHGDKSLETIGDFFLDWVIIDKFATQERYTAQQTDEFCQWYGKNENLRYFAGNGIQVPRYILRGQDERKQQKWDRRQQLSWQTGSGCWLQQYTLKMVLMQ